MLRAIRRMTAVSLLAGLASLAPVHAQQRPLPSAAAPELDQLLQAKESGLLTEWRFAGPFGHSAEFARPFPPEKDWLKHDRYGDHRVFSAQFATGRFELPRSLVHEGVYYASSQVYLSSGGEWRLYAETAGLMEVFVDGTRALARVQAPGESQTSSEVLHLERGEHKVLVKFTAAAAPFHVAVMPRTGGVRKRNNKPQIYKPKDAEIVSAGLTAKAGGKIRG